MTDTEVLDWKDKSKVYKEKSSTVNWILLKEQEEYMATKGFLIGYNFVITPQGERVCLNMD